MDKRSEYYAMVGTCPNVQVVHAVSTFTGPRRQALDLGAGNLRDTRHLLKEGFESVVAVDRAPMPNVTGVERVQEPLEHYLPMPNTFDLAVCCNVLFFIPKENAEKVIVRAYNALTEHGLLVFNLLGDTDEWVVKGQHAAVGYSKAEVDRLLSCFENKTVDRSGGSFPRPGQEPKYWDILRVSVQKS
jgi:SAM-dependent methyltransferase